MEVQIDIAIGHTYRLNQLHWWHNFFPVIHWYIAWCMPSRHKAITL